MMPDGVVGLVARRLVDMTSIHPSQDNSKVCSKCGARVGIYPSGQRALKKHRGAFVICVQCALAEDDPTVVNMPAAPIEELLAEARDSVKVPRG